MKTKIDVCNLALARLGDKQSIEDIDNPTNQLEMTLSRWYDISRRSTLRTMMPSFARARKKWILSNHKPAFGYTFAYKCPVDCLKVIGVGDADNPDNDYVVEGGYILTNNDYAGELPVRYVKDVEDVALFDDLFVELFSLLLAFNIAPEVTENANIITYLANTIKSKTAEVLAVAGQENKPIIVKDSRLAHARKGLYFGVSKK
jgi:hypothetical protein